MEDIKERIKQHEGFRRTMYSDSLGFATIGYGHLVLDTDNFVEGVEYSKEELDAVFESDFKIALTSAEELLEGLDVLVIEALHHRDHFSHYTLEQAVEQAKKIGAKQTYFIHMSHYMGLHETVSSKLPENMYLSYDGLEIYFN